MVADVFWWDPTRRDTTSPVPFTSENVSRPTALTPAPGRRARPRETANARFFSLMHKIDEYEQDCLDFEHQPTRFLPVTTSQPHGRRSRIVPIPTPDDPQ